MIDDHDLIPTLDPREAVCPVHHLAYWVPAGACPECVDFVRTRRRPTATDLDPCAGCPIQVTRTTAVDQDEEDEDLGLCEWGGSTNFCVRDATGRYPGGEALCESHAIALYGE